MRRPAISPVEMRRRGWVRIDPRPWKKTTARWVHRDGWGLGHCGHPTAHHPWVLTMPGGEEILTGIIGPYREPAFGTCWDSLEEATDAARRIIAAGGIGAWMRSAPEPPDSAWRGQVLLQASARAWREARIREATA